ncbi:helix-turn-helix domain-containing protein [Mucilaginibacter myungsuensis]|uniref:Helix-turn-helix domain-containing protein n=1 Tax=Mucilaginibacter myungsuensis TaxID=649104 RepID=A0A929PX53_9SPHI|nr:helix-turn-helix domain-containing protein [Mucilaginibacter myungsuensis]MBE9663498.1 helix-turn-helix domain-containing protein [Mucilaginibacter myungsuensis]MDN3600236.1 helix-turn-helix domain-containing protein [Mucilaginibacter myungsuensis]
MDKLEPQQIGSLIKQSRIKKGYTQQQVADMTQLSLRSVQRIEKGEVMPRQYSLDVLARQLEFAPIMMQEELTLPKVHAVDAPQPFNNARRLILTLGSAILLTLLTGAFISQSRGFPENHFEAFLLWTGVTISYLFFVWRLWR